MASAELQVLAVRAWPALGRLYGLAHRAGNQAMSAFASAAQSLEV
jgi:hypothetical protein